MSDYEVTVLKPGYAEWIGPTQQKAGGTITLVKGPKHIVVDTGGSVALADRGAWEAGVSPDARTQTAVASWPNAMASRRLRGWSAAIS
jgi:hypothetical protein